MQHFVSLGAMTLVALLTLRNLHMQLEYRVLRIVEPSLEGAVVADVYPSLGPKEAAIYSAPSFSRSTLILHVGPGKMGTTYLQCTLQRKSVENYLEQDGYLFIGKVASNCGLPTEETPASRISYFEGNDFFNKNKTSLAPHFVDQLSEWKSRGGRHAIIVSEHLSTVPSERLRLFYELKGWDIRVVVGYRQYFEYLSSRYSQDFRPKPDNEWARLWPGEKGQHEVGRPILAFDVDNRGEFSERYQKAVSTVRHPSESMVIKFSALKPKSLNVVQLPYLPPTPPGDPYLVNLMCSLLDSPATCEAAKMGTIGIYNESINPSYPIDLDTIATEAKARGWIRSGLLRTAVVSSLQQSSTLPKPPRVCIPAMDQILNLSIAMEVQLFGDETHVEEHRASFRSKADSKYCHLNATAALEMKEWREFIQRL